MNTTPVAYMIVYRWPFSQICSECQYGSFVMSDGSEHDPVGPAAFICTVNCIENNGTFCPRFIVPNHIELECM